MTVQDLLLPPVKLDSSTILNSLKILSKLIYFLSDLGENPEYTDKNL